MHILMYAKDGMSSYLEVSDEFGTSDFLEENYSLYAEGTIYNEFVPVYIWQADITKENREDIPRWLVESGDFVCEYIGFDNIYYMIEKLNCWNCEIIKEGD